MPIARVTEFVRGGSSESFAELALAVFRCQVEASERYRALCRRRGLTPEELSDWRQAPPVPPRARASPEPPGGDAARDSPNRRDLRRELHHAVFDRSFPTVCLAGMERPPVLSLIPAAAGPDTPQPGLPIDHLLRAWAAPDSLVAVARRGVEVARARSFLGARQRDRRPTLILGDTAALDRLLEALERRGLRFRLPPGSRVVESGRRGTGGRELLARLAQGLGLPPEAVVREYALDGLTTRFYARLDPHGRSGPFAPLPWARVRALDPESGDELPAGAEGELAVFDLASVGAAAHVLTGHAGTAGEEGFRLATEAG